MGYLMNIKFTGIILLSGVSCISLCSIESGYAAGFYLTEVGTPSSLGTAGVANPTHTEGADASWSNPAAMSYLDDEQMLVGFQVIVPNIEFSAKSATTTQPVPGIPIQGGNGGNAGVATPVPSVFYVKPLSDEWRFGFSMAGLMGGGYDYGDNFVGRYAIQSVELAGLGITPSLSYRVNDKLALGGGITILYTVFNQEIAVRQPGFSDGKAQFEDLTDWGVQGVLSLTYELSDRALLGVVYRTEADVELEGDIKLRNMVLPLPSKGDAAIDWTNPQWLDVGLRYDVSEQTQIFLNAGWQEWSAFSDNYITIGSNGNTNVLNRNWDDTWYAGVAAKHQLSERSAFNLGISYDSSPVKNKYRTLDMALDEMWKLSAAYGWKGGKLDYSIGVTLYLIDDAPIDQTTQGVRVVGDYDSNSMLFIGGTLRYHF